MAKKDSPTAKPAEQTPAAEPLALPDIPLPTSGGCWIRSADGLGWDRDPTEHPPAAADASQE